MTTIHLGIFLGQALWADSVSPRTNTIVLCDQFKPIRIRENLAVSYNQQLDYEPEFSTTMAHRKQGRVV